MSRHSNVKEESSGEELWSDYSSEEDSGLTSDAEQGGYGPDVNEMTPEKFMAEAPIEYSTASFWINKRFKVEDLYDSNGKLINEGKIALSLKNGDFELSNHSSPDDFAVEAEIDPAPLSNGSTQLDARRGAHRKPHNHHQRKYKPRKKRARRDLFKSAHLRKFTTNWEGPLGVAMPTVPALYGEGHHGKSGVVCNVFAHGEMSATEPRDYTIKVRPVTVGMAVFNNRYAGQRLDNWKDSVAFLANKSVALLPLNSPWTMYCNAGESDPANRFHEPSVGHEAEGMIKVPIALYRKYEKVTDHEMETKLSMADVTDDLVLEFFVPMETGHRMKEHERFRQTGKGIPWDHFADHKAHLSLADLSLAATQLKNGQSATQLSASNPITQYKQKEFYLRGFLDLKYIRCDGRKIAMDTTKC